MGSGAGLHPQDARDNKLTVEIGERHSFLSKHAALAHMRRGDLSLSHTQRPDKAGVSMLRARCSRLWRQADCQYPQTSLMSYDLRSSQSKSLWMESSAWPKPPAGRPFLARWSSSQSIRAMSRAPSGLDLQRCTFVRQRASDPVSSGQWHSLSCGGIVCSMYLFCPERSR